ncbi:TetR/AcrR family transcriptional regulator [Actinomycetospora flava]|uniref:TetR/AcrR family transcriptional regulator n=1 Tax=Actinomycetospora flava TaxID=3129232 RepID=A0ABU8M1D4_9PSEU
MAGRPIDHEHRAALLDAAVDHATEQVFAELSWRSVAAALGVSTTTLVHHFGTKEQMLAAILDRLRERLIAGSRDLAGEHADLATTARAFWTWSADERRWPTLRLFFAVYGQALQSPDAHAGFLGQVGSDWTAALRAAQGPDVDPDLASRRATLVVATLRGLLLDLLASGDRARVEDAAEAYLASL